ncbi:MAG TPA: ABC transporter substrate-binding protein [Nevskiaceae bacterium]|nr:ABC transporter substrate-binding protein [Nevskiaceae bacterium]
MVARALILLLVLAALLLWRGRSGPESAAPAAPERVVLALPSQPANAGWFLGLARGDFRAEGIELIDQPHDTGVQALNAVLAGQADLAIVADTPFMFAVMEGADIVIALTSYNSRTNLAILGRRDRGIAEVADLAGRRIGFVPRTNAQFFLDSFLLVHRLSATTTRVALTPASALPALVRGEVDALAAWEPILSRGRAQLSAGFSEFQAPEVYTFRFNLVGRRAYVQQNGTAIRRMIRALHQANLALRSDPAAALAAIRPRLGTLDPGLVLQPADYQTVLDQALLMALEDQARWALRQGLVPTQSQPDFLAHLAADALLAERPLDVGLVRGP